jgi:hypothetical protein
LPTLPQIGLSLYRAQTMAGPAVNRLEELLLQAVHETIRRVTAA